MKKLIVTLLISMLTLAACQVEEEVHYTRYMVIGNIIDIATFDIEYEDCDHSIVVLKDVDITTEDYFNLVVECGGVGYIKATTHAIDYDIRISEIVYIHIIHNDNGLIRMKSKDVNPDFGWGEIDFL